VTPEPLFILRKQIQDRVSTKGYGIVLGVYEDYASKIISLIFLSSTHT
jgi:hypothetical protein